LFFLRINFTAALCPIFFLGLDVFPLLFEAILIQLRKKQQKNIPSLLDMLHMIEKTPPTATLGMMSGTVIGDPSGSVRSAKVCAGAPLRGKQHLTRISRIISHSRSCPYRAGLQRAEEAVEEQISPAAPSG
jgi:hypothetical protein